LADFFEFLSFASFNFVLVAVVGLSFSESGNWTTTVIVIKGESALGSINQSIEEEEVQEGWMDGSRKQEKYSRREGGKWLMVAGSIHRLVCMRGKETAQRREEEGEDEEKRLDCTVCSRSEEVSM
jgi:hypothetical protein